MGGVEFIVSCDFGAERVCPADNNVNHHNINNCTCVDNNKNVDNGSAPYDHKSIDNDDNRCQ
jgi:hypothetical protein